MGFYMLLLTGCALLREREKCGRTGGRKELIAAAGQAVAARWGVVLLMVLFGLTSPVLQLTGWAGAEISDERALLIPAGIHLVCLGDHVASRIQKLHPVCRPVNPQRSFFRQKKPPKIAGRFQDRAKDRNEGEQALVNEEVMQLLLRIPHDIVVGEDGPVTYSCMLEADSVFFCDEAYYYAFFCHRSRTEKGCRIFSLCGA